MTQVHESTRAARCHEAGFDAADQTMRHGDSQRVKRMVDTPREAVAPSSALDPLGLLNIAEAVGERGLAMADDPAEQDRRRGHEHSDPFGVLQGGHACWSFPNSKKPVRRPRWHRPRRHVAETSPDRHRRHVSSSPAIAASAVCASATLAVVDFDLHLIRGRGRR